MRVEVRGDGIAAYCCVHLLRKAGIATRLLRADRPRVPALLLGEAALQLVREIFERPDLLRHRPPIRRRIVAWDRAQPPLALEHSGLVTSEQALLGDLLPGDASFNGESDWTIHCGQPLPEGVTSLHLGARRATGSRVLLRGVDAAHTCVMESLAAGWLFLLPVDERNGWLLATGETGTDPLTQSRVASERVEQVLETTVPFAAHPRIASRLSGARWLACGSAAMSFDPICGDGTALAVRAAILAAAVLRAVARGEDAAALLHHYEARLRAGFGRHVALCREYYRRGFGGAWWEAEVAALDAWSPNPTEAFHYRLAGFDLEPVAGPAR